MATETLAVTLLMQANQYKREARQAASATGQIGTQAAATGTATGKLQGQMRGLGQTAKVAVGIGAAAAVAGFTRSAVTGFLDFDDKMNESLAIMGDVSEAMRGDMSDAAREVGRTTRIGADEAAEAYFFLASAGLDAEQSIAALPQVAAFAQAGMFDMATATDLATDAQSALGLVVDDAQQNLMNLTQVTDVLVGANTLANASVQQFSEALTNKAGAAARAVGIDIEETVAVLSVFADQGIKGAEAGTQFAIVLRDLQTKALQNKEAFEAAGISVFDAQGEFRNMGDIVSELEDRLNPMSDEMKKAELATLGFSDKSIAALTVLLGTSDAIQANEESLRDMAGTTQEIADNQLESMRGQLELAKGAVDDMALSLGSVLAPALVTVSEGLRIVLADDQFDKIAIQTGFAAGGAENLTVALSMAADELEGFDSKGGADGVEDLADAFRSIVLESEASVDELRRLRGGLDFLVEAGHLTEDQARQLSIVLGQELAPSLTETEIRAREAYDAVRDMKDPTDDLAESAGAADRKFFDYAAGLEDIGDEAGSAVPDMRDMAEAIAAVNDAARTAADPVFAAITAVNRLEEAAEDGNADFFEMAELTLDAQSALAGLGAGNLQAGIKAIADAMDEPVGKVAQMLEDLGILDTTNWTANLLFDISADPADIKFLNQVGNLSGNTTRTSASTEDLRTINAIAAGAMQHGGPVRAGSPYVVGESGPELFIPQRSGQVIPNSQAGTMSMGGGTTVYLTGDVYGFDDFADKVAAAGVSLNRMGR